MGLYPLWIIRRANVPEGAWEPERVQVRAQALILEENGYTVDCGTLYFVEAKRRVTVELSEELRARTISLLEEMRARFGTGVAPSPLVDSPKCPRCSLVGICLPDETNLLQLRRGRNEQKVRGRTA